MQRVIASPIRIFRSPQVAYERFSHEKGQKYGNLAYWKRHWSLETLKNIAQT